MGFEGWSDLQVERFLARCRRAALAVDVDELEDCRAVIEEQTGLSAAEVLAALGVAS